MVVSECGVLAREKWDEIDSVESWWMGQCEPTNGGSKIQRDNGMVSFENELFGGRGR